MALFNADMVGFSSPSWRGDQHGEVNTAQQTELPIACHSLESGDKFRAIQQRETTRLSKGIRVSTLEKYTASETSSGVLRTTSRTGSRESRSLKQDDEIHKAVSDSTTVSFKSVISNAYGKAELNGSAVKQDGKMVERSAFKNQEEKSSRKAERGPFSGEDDDISGAHDSPTVGNDVHSLKHKETSVQGQRLPGNSCILDGELACGRTSSTEPGHGDRWAKFDAAERRPLEKSLDRPGGRGSGVIRRDTWHGLGKVVDDLKSQSTSLEQTVEDLKKKRSKSVDEIETSDLKLGRQTASDVTRRGSDSNAQSLNTRKALYRAIPARAEYVTTTRAASTRYYKGSDFEWDDFPFGLNTPSGKDDHSSRIASTKSGSIDDRSESASAAVRRFDFSRDENLFSGKDTTNSVEKGLLEPDAEAFVGKDAPPRTFGESMKTNVDLKVPDEVKTFKGEVPIKTGRQDNWSTSERSENVAHRSDVAARHKAKVLGDHGVTAGEKEGNGRVRLQDADDETRNASTGASATQTPAPHITNTTYRSLDSIHSTNEISDNTRSSTRTYYLIRSQRTEPLVNKANETPNDGRKARRERTPTTGAPRRVGDGFLRDKLASRGSAESSSVTLTTDTKKKERGGRSALWEKIEKLKTTVDSLNGLKSKKDLEEYLKQHSPQETNIKQTGALAVQRYMVAEDESGRKEIRAGDGRDLEGMTLEELEVWRQEKAVARERERRARQEEQEQRRRALQHERENRDKAMMLDRERELRERREKIVSLEKKLEKAEREREELKKKWQGELELERQRRQEEERRLQKDREKDRRESVQLESEREDLKNQLEKLKAEKEGRERDIIRLQETHHRKLMVIEKEKEIAKVELEKLDRAWQRRESEVTRLKSEQEEKIRLLQRENEESRLDREGLLEETNRLASERREGVLLLAREKQRAKLEREKLEHDRRRRERDVAGIEEELRQRMMVLREETEAARSERQRLEIQAAKLETERRQKVENLEQENQAAKAERERLKMDRDQREKERVELEKGLQVKMAILQMEIDAAREERDELEEERQKRDKEAESLKKWQHCTFQFLEEEKEIVDLERKSLNVERQERVKEAAKEEENRRIEMMILEKEKRAVLSERERLKADKEDARRELLYLETQRTTADIALQNNATNMLSQEMGKENLQSDDKWPRSSGNISEIHWQGAQEMEMLVREPAKSSGHHDTNVEENDVLAMNGEKRVVRVESESTGRQQNGQIRRNDSNVVTVVQVGSLETNGKLDGRQTGGHDTEVTYVEIDHSLKARPQERRPMYWWTANTAEGVDKILQLDHPTRSTAVIKTENSIQLRSNDLRKPRRMNGIRRRSMRRKSGRRRAQAEDDDGVEVCVRVRAKEKNLTANSAKRTETRAPLENTIILRQARQIPAPVKGTLTVDGEDGAGIATLENGVVKIREAKLCERETWSEALNRGEKFSESDGSNIVSMGESDPDFKMHNMDSSPDSSPTVKFLPVRMTSGTPERPRTKQLKFARDFSRSGSFSRGRRASIKKVSGTSGKHRKGLITATSAANESNGQVVFNQRKARFSPMQTVQKIKRLYKTTDRATGWTYKGGRLEVTVQPSSVPKAHQQYERRMTSGGHTVGSDAVLLSARVSNGDQFERSRDPENFAGTRRWKVIRRTDDSCREMGGDARSVPFHEKYEVISDTGYNTFSDGEVGRPWHGRAGQISGGERSPTDHSGSTGSSHKETEHCHNEKMHSRKMRWAVGDLTSKRKLVHNKSPRYRKL